MSIPFQIRRMSTGSRILVTPAVGEFLLDTTTQRLFLGDGSTAGGVSVDWPVINEQTGASYTIAATDAGKLVTFTNGGTTTVTLNQAGSSSGEYFPAGTGFWIESQTGLVIINPTTSIIYGGFGGGMFLQPGQATKIISDGTDYYAIPGAMGGRKISAHTTDYSPFWQDTTRRFNNAGAAGAVVFTLPPTTADLEYEFAVMASQTITINANGGNLIKGIGFSAGTIASSTLYSVLKLEVHTSGIWLITNKIGTWA